MTQGEGKGQKRGREAAEAGSLPPSSSSPASARSLSLRSFLPLGSLHLTSLRGSRPPPSSPTTPLPESFFFFFSGLPSIRLPSLPFPVSVPSPFFPFFPSDRSYIFCPFFSLSGWVFSLSSLLCLSTFPSQGLRSHPPLSALPAHRPPSPAQCFSPPRHWNSKVNDTPFLAHRAHGLMKDSDPAAECPIPG